MWAAAYLRTKWHLDPPCRLVTADMGRKWWLPYLFFGRNGVGGTVGPHLT